MILAGQIIINGLASASFDIFIALGITLVYGLTGIIVFCQAELLTIGALVCITTLAITHNFVLGLLAAVVVISILGFFLER